MARLRKRDVEQLLDRYDDDPRAALVTALRRVLDRPDAGWETLLALAPLDDDRRARLAAGDEHALDALAAELNERREL